MGLMAIQYFIAAIGIVTLGMEYYDQNSIRNFPAGLNMRINNELRKRTSLSSLDSLEAFDILQTSTNSTMSFLTMSTMSTMSTSSDSESSGKSSNFSTDSSTMFTSKSEANHPIVRKCVDEPEKDDMGKFMECNDDDRDRTLTIFLLAFFVGGLGIARCVAGFWCLGVVQAFTCGGCGIWWLLDWIFVLTLTWTSSANGCCFSDNMSL